MQFLEKKIYRKLLILSFHLRKIDKQQQIKPQESGRKEIVKMKAETEMKKKIHSGENEQRQKLGL